MKLAVIGQSAFGAEVYKALAKTEHQVVAVFTIPDTNGREDLLAQAANADGVSVREFLQFDSSLGLQDNQVEAFAKRRWGCNTRGVGSVQISGSRTQRFGFRHAVHPYVCITEFLLSHSREVIDAPKHGSIVYHPSLLPRHRGASAINWTLMEGDKKVVTLISSFKVQAGFTIFFADDGLDTGPILLMKVCHPL